MRIVVIHVLSALTLLAAAGCEPRPTLPGDAGAGCSSDPDCDDGFACTVDTCVVGGVCQHSAIDERCGAGETCLVGRGCVSGMTCTTSIECTDAHACTVDSCGVDGMCRHMPLSELCTDPAAPVCDATMGCIRGTGCASATECEDSVPCTIDSCNAARMCTHTPMDSLCDTAAGETCTATGCRASTSCTSPADCDDGMFCNGTEICDAKFGCLPGDPPGCNDSNTCTIDSCSNDLGRCVFDCDRSMTACAGMPGCEVAPTSCTGTFTGTPAAPARCAFGARPDLSTMTFSYDGVVLTVVDGRPGFPDLTDVTEPACPSFTATATVDGGCREIYTLTGEFTDDDNFTGTFTAEYVDMDGFSCSVCMALYTTPVTGVRR